MTTTVDRDSDGAATIASDKINGKSARFPMSMEMVTALVCEDGREKAPQGATLSTSFTKPLKLSGSPKVEEIKALKYKDGGTQSQNFLIKMKDAPSYFMKLLGRPTSSAKNEQQNADRMVRAHIAEESSPFVLTAAYITIKVSNLDKKKVETLDALVFEHVDAIQIINEKDKKKHAQKLGTLLGSLYKNQLTKEGRLKKFYEEDGVLTKVLVHEDFQASNILCDRNSDKVFVVDIGGIRLSTDELDAYRNIREALEMTPAKEESKTLIKAFLREFEPEHQGKILASLISSIKKKATPDLSGRSADFDAIESEILEKKK